VEKDRDKTIKDFFVIGYLVISNFLFFYLIWLILGKFVELLTIKN